MAVPATYAETRPASEPAAETGSRDYRSVLNLWTALFAE
jgi:hypothetical protein